MVQEFICHSYTGAILISEMVPVLEACCQNQKRIHFSKNFIKMIFLWVAGPHLCTIFRFRCMHSTVLSFFFLSSLPCSSSPPTSSLLVHRSHYCPAWLQTPEPKGSGSLSIQNRQCYRNTTPHLSPSPPLPIFIGSPSSSSDSSSSSSSF